MAFIAFMVGSGMVVEVVRALVLRKRHRMSLHEYYRRRARGEEVPNL